VNTWRIRFARPGFTLGVGVVLLWVLVALFAPVLAPHDPLHSFAPLLPPGGGFVLGTDLLGRDILSRLIWGARPVLGLSLVATLTAYAVGISAGLAAGYFRGATDAVLSFAANVILSFPVLVLYLVVIVALGASYLNVILAVTFGSAPAVFRIVRGVAIDIAHRDYVAAARTQGEPDWRILAVDILPNAAPALGVDFCLRLGYTAITIGALGFLGLGLPPPAPDWGGMVTDGRALAFAFPHLVIAPCLAITSLVLALSLIADGLRVDP
jgi:ABC-type dipeptide/oligopeptide/nickel transport system permease subunit